MTLAARALSFGYPGREVGRGLDLDLGAGEVLCTGMTGCSPIQRESNPRASAF